MPPLLRLAFPLILGELGWIAMSFVDTVMVGHLPDAALAMAASALSSVLFNTLAFGVAGILLGLDSLISQAFGAEDVPTANRWLLHGLVMAAALSVVLTGLFIATPYALSRLPVDPRILAGAIPALRGLNWGVLPLLMYFTLRRYLQAGNHGRPIAIALISANIVNAIMNWVLIFGHHFVVAGHEFNIAAYGVRGSAWSTSLARVYLMLALLVAVWRADRRHSYGLKHVTLKIEFEHLRHMFKLGAPAGASILVEIAIFALVTSLIATFGALQLAGHEIALQCASTSFMVPFAISAATSVRVGNAIGRWRSGNGTHAQVLAAGWCGIAAGAAVMLIASLSFVFLPATLSRLFTPDPAVIAAAVPLLVIAAGFQFFDGIQINATGALRGAGITTTPLYTHLCCYWVVGMPLGLWLAFHHNMGARGLWFGLLIALFGASVVLVTVWNTASKTLTVT